MTIKVDNLNKSQYKMSRVSGNVSFNGNEDDKKKKTVKKTYQVRRRSNLMPLFWLILTVVGGFVFKKQIGEFLKPLGESMGLIQKTAANASDTLERTASSSFYAGSSYGGSYGFSGGGISLGSISGTNPARSSGDAVSVSTANSKKKRWGIFGGKNKGPVVNNGVKDSVVINAAPAGSPGSKTQHVSINSNPPDDEWPIIAFAQNRNLSQGSGNSARNRGSGTLMPSTKTVLNQKVVRVDAKAAKAAPKISPEYIMSLFDIKPNLDIDNDELWRLEKQFLQNLRANDNLILSHDGTFLVLRDKITGQYFADFVLNKEDTAVGAVVENIYNGNNLTATIVKEYKNGEITGMKLDRRSAKKENLEPLPSQPTRQTPAEDIKRKIPEPAKGVSKAKQARSLKDVMPLFKIQPDFPVTKDVVGFDRMFCSNLAGTNKNEWELVQDGKNIILKDKKKDLTLANITYNSDGTIKIVENFYTNLNNLEYSLTKEFLKDKISRIVFKSELWNVTPFDSNIPSTEKLYYFHEIA